MLTGMRLSDRKTVERVLRGKRESFGLLVTRHYAAAYAVAYARVGNRSDAEDAVQAAFLKAFERLDSLRDSDRFGPWLLSIASNAALEILRRRHREETARAELMGDEATITPDLERDELHAAVRAQIMELEEGPREILLLYYFAGKRLREIAALLEITPNAAKLRLQRARMALGQELLHVLDGAVPANIERKRQCSRIMALVATMPVAWDHAAAATAGATAAPFFSALSLKSLFALLLLLALGSLGWIALHEQSSTSLTTATEQPESGKPASHSETPADIVQDQAAGIVQTAEPGFLARGGVIAGVLIDVVTQEPITDASARVIAQRGSSKRQTAVSADGQFRFDNLPGGAYEIFAVGDFIVPPAEAVEVSIDKQQAVENLRVAVSIGGVISGRVYDNSNGRGISAASVSAAPRSRSEDRPAEARTDAAGVFRLTGVPAGFVRVTCSPPEGYAQPRPEAQQAAVKAGQTLAELNFPIDQGIAAAGIVIDERGDPIAGAQVLGRGKDGGSAAETHSDADGKFVLLGLNPTTELYVLGAAEGYGCVPAGPFDLKAGGLTDVVVTLLPEGSVEGRVLDNLNQPVLDARVTMEPGFPYPFETSSATPDETGVFVLPRLAPGAYQLRLAVDGAYQQEQAGAKVLVEKGETVKGIVLRYVRGNLSISGRVTSLDKEPLPGLNVSCVGSHAGQTVASDADTDTDGHYEIKGLGEGTYELHVFHPDYMAARLSGIEAGAKNIDFQLGPAAIIDGQVVQTEGTPLTDFEVLVHPGFIMEVAPWMEREFVRFHDEAGKFSLKAVDGMGVAFVAARAPGFTPAAVQTGVGPGQHVEGLVIRLKPARSVRGIVTDSAGMPIEGALVFSGGLPENATPEAGAEARTDEAGQFVLATLRAGAQKVSAYHAAYAPGWAAVPEEAETLVHIVLPGKSVLRGQLTVNGQPVPGDWVKVTYQQPGALREEQAQTAADGVYRFDDLAPGRVTVSAAQYVPTGERSVRHELSVPAELVSGMETNVDLAFTQGTALLQGTVFLGGVPVTSGDVLARAADDAGEIVVEDGLEASGEYQLAGLPEGPLTLEIEIGGADLPKKRKTETVQLRAGEDNVHDVHFDANGGRLIVYVEGAAAGLGVVRGAVEFGADEAPLDIYTRIGPILVWEGESAPATSTVLENLDPGVYTVLAVATTSGSEHPVASSIVEITDGGEASVALQLP